MRQIETLLGLYELSVDGWQNPDTYNIYQCMDRFNINHNRIDAVRQIVEAVGVMLHSMFHEEVFNEVPLYKIQAAANMAIRHLFKNIG